MFFARKRTMGKGLVVVTAAMSAIGLGACGGSSSSSSSSSQSSSATPSGGGKVAALAAKAKTAVTQAEGAQTSRPPTSGPKALKSKSIVVLSCSQAAEGCARPVAAEMEAIKRIGWKGLLIDGAGDPAKIQAAFGRAISLKADGMIVNSIDSQVVAASIKKAEAAGIKVVGSVAGATPPLWDAVVPTRGNAGFNDGYLMGQEAYVLTNGHPHLLMSSDNEFAYVTNRVMGTQKFIADCKAAGGDCKILATQQIQVADLATTVPQQAASLARQYTGWNVFWGPYDAALGFQIQGLKQAGLTNQSLAVGFDGNSANVDMVRSSGYEKATVALPMQWVGYADVDALNRLFSGQKPVDEGITTKLIVPSNAPKSGPFNGDVDVRPLYAKIWGVK